MSRTKKRDYDFMGIRWWCLGVSAVLLAISAVLLVKPGLRWGTDFKGGTEVEVQFKKELDAATVRQTVASLGFASPDVVSVGGGRDHFLIKVQETSALDDAVQASVAKALCLVPEEGELTDPACPKELQVDEVKFSPGGDKISARYVESPCADPQAEVCAPKAGIVAQLSGTVEGLRLRVGENNPSVQNPREHKVEFYLESKGDLIMRGLGEKLGPELVPEAPLRVEWIGPKAGAQLRNAAITSISIAIIFIMAYIAFRFDMRFAPGAVIALVHDSGLAIGAMTAARLEFTLSTVAALLTIVGYSIADTVVVYDRVRENLGKHRKMTFPRIVNRSVTEMLRRTIRTSATTLVVLAPFLFFGTSVLQDFAFTLIVGIVVGTYSSIYVAAPVTEWIDRRFFGASVQRRQRRATRGTGGRPEFRQGDAVI